MVNFAILAGGYTSFVVSYLFNSHTNTLSILNQSPTGANPSWIALHPTNKSVLYAVNEGTQGALQSFLIGANGQLSSAIDTISSDGDSPAFTTPLSTGQVAIMNYNSGNGEIIPTVKGNPLEFSSDFTPIKFNAPVSHPHMAYEYGSEVFIPDLGADKVWRLTEKGSPGNWVVHGQIDQPTGSGPRHIAIRGNTLYTLHELASTLTQQTIPPAPNGTVAATVASFNITPPGLPAGAAMAAAEILVTETSPSFPEPFIYVSNRNTGVQDPRGDAIAIFRVEPALELLGWVFTGLDQIRGMQLGGPEKEFLIASGVAGDGGTVVLKRTDGGKNMTLLVRNTEIPTRTSFVWLN
ncbi:putative isomerase YbhE [Epithele typhae]|uniref:putative isomerase YbhE n=1 Tax=Epithele typhae TaxID=378194 RepID=UPI0020088089|nr:putative isomerase YbhE [Epithele typhae]KAH9920005.1 putative isomerase YbhE [Epithele typhae]